MIKKMSTTKKVLLGGALLVFGLPILLAMCSLATMSPEDKARINQEVAADQAKKTAARAEQAAAAASKQSAAAAEREKVQLVYRLCGWAQEAVKAQLRSPASAKFPDCVFGADEYQVRGSPDGKTYWVIGPVDSQNGFGAMLRSKYVVKFEHASPEAPYNIVQVAVE